MKDILGHRWSFLFGFSLCGCCIYPLSPNACRCERWGETDSQLHTVSSHQNGSEYFKPYCKFILKTVKERQPNASAISWYYAALCWWKKYNVFKRVAEPEGWWCLKNVRGQISYDTETNTVFCLLLSQFSSVMNLLSVGSRITCIC